ncbi:MAG: DUF5312 domain-containing protein [Spirochaetota bacterium]|nr:DUF5312 domain-containing protein [Spirochaetota bacterium]
MNLKNRLKSLTTNEDFNGESIFEKIILFFQNVFLGKDDANYQRKRMLKRIKRNIKNLKINVFNVSTNVITKKFAEIIFDLYRYTYPLKTIINIDKDKLVRANIERFFVEINLDYQQKDILNSFEKENMLKIFEGKGTKELDNLINNNFQDFQKSFSKELIDKINSSFSCLVDLNSFIQFDLYPLLRKFSSELKENSISEIPKFHDANSKFVVEDLKNMADIIYSIDLNSNFKDSFNILGQFKNMQILPEVEIKKFINQIKNIISENYLTLIISFIEENPYFRPIQNIQKVNLFQNYLKNLYYTIKTNRDNLVKSLRDNKINNLLVDLFGNVQINSIQNYTDENKELFIKAQSNYYTYTKSLNYLKYFLMEKYNHYIREALNNLLLHADFKEKKYHENFANSYYQCNNLMKQILSFDESLETNNKKAIKIKTLLRSSTNDVLSKKILNDTVDEINNSAKVIIMDAFTNFSNISSGLKLIYEDYKINSQTVITNSRSMSGGENKLLIDSLVKAYNDISKFLVIINAVSPSDFDKIE